MAALLKNTACAMQALEGVPPPAEASATREIEVEGVDRETLLVNWLNEIFYLEQVDRLVCTDFRIHECKNHHVRGRVEIRDAERRLTHIKAVTFHNLKVRETPGKVHQVLAEHQLDTGQLHCRKSVAYRPGCNPERLIV